VAPRAVAITPPPAKKDAPATQASDQRAEVPATQPADLAKAGVPVADPKAAERRGLITSVWKSWLDVSNYYMGVGREAASKSQDTTVTELPMDDASGNGGR
jgi:hypothetical protein